ncbi:MAG: hypothetical protein AAF958_16895 [Planctomycetota bacterium]
MVTKDVKEPLEYVDALDTIELNLAESCSKPQIRSEVKKFQKLFRERPDGWRPEGGFTEPLSMRTGSVVHVYLYRFALDSWSIDHLAGLIAHEATHVAGMPGDLITEALMGVLDEAGYERGPRR